jgi:putative ABC transport system permease protein
MALGAQTRDILRLIVRQGMKPVIFGLAIGMAAALAVGRLIHSQLYQSSEYNPLLLSASLTILGVAVPIVPPWSIP